MVLYKKQMITFGVFVGIVALVLFVLCAVIVMWWQFYGASQGGGTIVPGSTEPVFSSDGSARTSAPSHIFSIIPKQQPIQSFPSVATAEVFSAQKNNTLSWGVYPGWNKQDIIDFEQNVGNPNIIVDFVHFGNENRFPNDMAPYAKDKGRTLAIFWEYTDYTNTSVSQPKYSYDAILRGDWDLYMRSFAAETKAYGGPIILIPFSEMNGDWFPWSGTQNGNTPEKAVLAYRHVRDIFKGIDNVKFGWSPNQESSPDTPENAISRYYPGDTYVDYIGLDGFNFGGTQERSFDSLFGNALTILSGYDKPIYLFSMATAEGPGKAAWITDAFTVQIPKYPKIVGWIWFNENKERDWRVNSDPAALVAFRAIVP